MEPRHHAPEKKNLALLAPLALTATIALTGCGEFTPLNQVSESNVVEVNVPASAPNAGHTFQDGFLTTPDLKVAITDYRVIPAGSEGNEYGDGPVIAIWYDTTNLGASDKEITPISAFIPTFEAFQDNDPNIENSLSVGALPDFTFLETQTASIKPGGTIANAVAYELSDTTTPVDLVAKGINGEIGRMTFNLNEADAQTI